VFNDLLKRMFLYNGYKVTHVMNITDVDDRIITEAREQKIPFTDITHKYEKIFLDESKLLRIMPPTQLLRATESIPAMVVMIKTLLANGHAYKAEDGIYFDIAQFENYGTLALLDSVTKKKSRVLDDKYDKENAQDFALWKFYTESDGEVFWETELGKGRPGWHIECSAMSTLALGPTFDIHTGAIDLIFPHHTNEIAQSECATGKKFVNYWVHAGFLNMKDAKMSKSLGNILTMHSLLEKGHDPMHFRYFCLTTLYRYPLDFTFEGMNAAKNTYERLKRKVIELRQTPVKGTDKTKDYDSQFIDAINDDLNMPNALQVMWKVLDDKEFDSTKKLALLEKFCTVLGLGIKFMKEDTTALPANVAELVKKRNQARKNKDFKESDRVRDALVNLGYSVEDSKEGTKVKKA
jgi:cysteinyl-tRNA synthetase